MEGLDRIPPISYNEFVELYGGTYEEFSMRSLAYMLQQQPDLDSKTRSKWEAQLENVDRFTGRLATKSVI